MTKNTHTIWRIEPPLRVATYESVTLAHAKRLAEEDGITDWRGIAIISSEGVSERPVP